MLKDRSLVASAEAKLAELNELSQVREQEAIDKESTIENIIAKNEAINSEIAEVK